MKTIVHVNQAVIKANQKKLRQDPPLTVKTYKGNTKAREVSLHGDARVVYRPDKPLSCGARVWIETEGRVEIDPPAPIRLPTKFPDALLRIRWQPMTTLPEASHHFVCVMVQGKEDKVPSPMWATFKRDDSAKWPNRKKGDKRIVFESFYFDELMCEVFRGDENWKRLKAWGYVVRI